MDGSQLLKNEAITQTLLDECVTAASDKKGFVVLLKIKTFDNWLDLPENYAVCKKDLLSLIYKYCVEPNEFIDTNSKYIEPAVKEEGFHTSISIMTKNY